MYKFFSNLYTSSPSIHSFFPTLILIIFVTSIIVVLNRIIIKLIKTKINNIKIVNDRKLITIKSILINCINILTIFLVLVFVLNLLGFPIGNIITLLSAFSIALGFAAQAIVKDFLAGFFFIAEEQFSIGDTVTINNFTGVVEKINFRTTSIRGLNGELSIIPNGLIEIVTSYSKDFTRALVIASVDYKTNLNFAISILEDEMKIAKQNIPELLEIPNVDGVVSLGQNSVDIRILGKCEIDSKWKVERELLRLIKNRFDKENITIPFAQMVIHKD